MSKRTTIALVALNLALLAFIFFVERGRLSTGDVAGRSGHVLSRFLRERVNRVELVRGEDPAIVFVRERAEGADEDEVGTWVLAEPIHGAVDDDPVDSFLSALEWLDARRTLEGISAEDRARFGLDAPRFVVRFEVGDERVALRVGGEAPTGEGVYAAVDGEERAFVVGQDFVEAIDHDVDHFRAKELFSAFYPTDAVSIRLTGGGDAVVFERADRVWRLREPVRGWASAGIVDTLTRTLRDLEASRFVSESAGDLDRYGLDAPWRELTIRRPEGATGARVARLRVGAPCGEHEDERYAIAGEDGPVVCVAASALAPLELDRAGLREARLITLGDDAVERIDVEVGGRTLSLARAEARWELTVGDDTEPADDGAIASWLSELRSSRALEYESIEGAPGHGLDAPRATLTLHRSDGDGAQRVSLGERTDGGVWVRRGGEAVATRFEVAVEERLTPSPLRFRRRTLVEGVEAGDARSVSVLRGDVEERAVRAADGDWSLEAPVTVEANRGAARDLARLLAALSATRFVSETPRPEHGLATPLAVVSVRYEPDEGEARTVTLTVGAETVDGAYARQASGPVFEIARELLEATRRSLVSLDLLSVEASQVASVRIERGADVIEIRREGSGWRTAADETPDAERTRTLLDRLSTLRAATVLRYGALAAPTVRVTVTRREDTEGARVVAFGIGPTSGEGEAALAPVGLEDPAVVFGVRPELVEIFRTYTP